MCTNSNDAVHPVSELISTKHVKADGFTVWLLPSGKWHRTDGPAAISPQGAEYWYVDGVQHRIGGPAISIPNMNIEAWIVHGKLHRLDGPAYTFGGKIEWYIGGAKYTDACAWAAAALRYMGFQNATPRQIEVYAQKAFKKSILS